MTSNVLLNYVMI